MTEDEGRPLSAMTSASLADANVHIPIEVANYLHVVQQRLVAESDDGWVLHIETHVSYTFDGNGVVERKGGTYLHSRAHGAIAELTIGIDYENDAEMVTHVEPQKALTWGIAKILLLQ